MIKHIIARNAFINKWKTDYSRIILSPYSFIVSNTKYSIVIIRKMYISSSIIMFKDETRN